MCMAGQEHTQESAGAELPWDSLHTVEWNCVLVRCWPHVLEHLNSQTNSWVNAVLSTVARSLPYRRTAVKLLVQTEALYPDDYREEKAVSNSNPVPPYTAAFVLVCTTP